MFKSTFNKMGFATGYRFYMYSNSQGEVYARGYNQYGQLGTGNTENAFTDPVKVLISIYIVIEHVTVAQPLRPLLPHVNLADVGGPRCLPRRYPCAVLPELVGVHVVVERIAARVETRAVATLLHSVAERLDNVRELAWRELELLCVLHVHEDGKLQCVAVDEIDAIAFCFIFP